MSAWVNILSLADRRLSQQHQPNYGYGSEDSGSNKKPIITSSTGSGTTRIGLTYSPDVVHQATTGPFQYHRDGSRGTPGSGTPITTYEYSFPDTNSNHTSKSSTSDSAAFRANLNSVNGFLRPASEHHYEQPMVIFPPAASTLNDSLHPRSESGTSSSTSTNDRSATNQLGNHPSPVASPVGTFEQGIERYPLVSTPMPALPHPPPPPLPPSTVGKGSGRCCGARYDPKFTSWSTVTHSGVRLTIPDSRVCLTVPLGAVDPGQSVDIFVSVSHGLQHPRLQANKETLLSPLVMFGPPEAVNQLKKPVVLSMPHCASLMHGNWSVSVLKSENQLDGGGGGNESRFNNNLDALVSGNGSLDNSWHKVVTLGQETINTPMYAQLDVSTCHLMTDAFAAYTLVGESASKLMSLTPVCSTKSSPGAAVKCLRLAAFAQEGPAQPADLTLRVYCLPDTDDALSFVSDSEKRYNGRLLDEPVSLLFADTGDDLCFSVDDLNSFWSCQQGADYLEMPFAHIWGSSNPSLHCSFTFRPSRERPTSNPNKLSLAISVWQKNRNFGGGNGNRAKCCLLKINCDLSERSGLSHAAIDDNSNCGQIPSPYGTSPADTGRFRISPTATLAISRLLDAPNSQGTDWRLLAERLTVHRYITFFATRPSPTESILLLWEARNRELSALSNLIDTLRGMGRFDAAAVLEHDL